MYSDCYSVSLLSNSFIDKARTGKKTVFFNKPADLEDPWLRDQQTLLKREAESLIIDSIPVLTFNKYRLFDYNGNRSEYESVYFLKRKRLLVFGLLAYLDESDKNISELQDCIWNICDEYTWALPAHLGGNSLNPDGSIVQGRIVPHRQMLDLFACETAFALSEILYLLEERLDPLLADRVRKECFSRVLDPFAESAFLWPFEEMKNNWCAVCAGSIGACALYLMDNSEKKAGIIHRTMKSLDNFLDSFSDDGVCLEGLGYWNYGFGFFVAYADLLKQFTGNRVDVLNTEKVSRIAAFPQACYLNDHISLAFSDAVPHEKTRPGLYAYLQHQYRDLSLLPVSSLAGILDDPCARWSLSFRDLVWSGMYRRESSGPDTKENNKATTFYPFPVAQWFVLQDYSGALCFAIKGGNNDEPHNHNDAGSFMLCKGSDEFITDLGSGEYVKDYFNERRYLFLCNSSRGHSVPIINHFAQEAGPDSRAELLSYEERESGQLCITLDLSRCYPAAAGLKRFIRTLLFIPERECMELRDYVSLNKEGPVSITERFISRLSIKIHEDKTIAIQGKNSELLLNDSSGIALPEINQEQYKDHNGCLQTISILDFSVNDSQEKEFEFCFLFHSKKDV